ncbi:MAG: class I SAM-dependent methyltransferase [Myxococcales bacterium]|nr:class I SAM-dependent methyltransferase [Myxococcales bacterium]
MTYPGRPGPSPVIAGLVAAGVIRPEHAVLDVGCGRGTDVVALARWGVRKVTGLDTDAGHLAQATAKAQRHRVARRTAFHLGSITEKHTCFDDGEFDVVIDSLCWNNLPAGETGAYIDEVWRLLAPGGTLVLQAKWGGRVFEPTGNLPRRFHRFFHIGPRVKTHLAERGVEDGMRDWTTVLVCVGQRRDAPLRR